ncbi:MAG: xanthine permease [Oscillospiraceae bacterium]|jgi:uracil permease|nr:xanthine permease [Oscillospiraceae bacterium]
MKSQNSSEPRISGYLPGERPPIGKMLIFALQQLVVIFPATVLVALITGFDIATTIFASGFATIVFTLVTRGKLPLYFGSSFSYISAIAALLAQRAVEADGIQIAQFGIICSGLISIIAGLIINKFGEKLINRILPPIVTGSVAAVIGLSLAGSTINNLVGNYSDIGRGGANFLVSNLHLVAGVITLAAIIVFSVKLKGIAAQIPILLAVAVGYASAVILGLIFKVNVVDFSGIRDAKFVALPGFSLPKFSPLALLAITPIAIATIPESSAHLFQIDTYISRIAKEKGVKDPNIKKHLGLNLIGDGVADIAASVFGGPGGTSYGEHISTMSLTKNFSVATVVTTAIFAIIVSFSGILSQVIYSIPAGVVGGLSIFTFGMIAVQGFQILIENKVDLFDVRNIAIIAVIFIVGLAPSVPIFGFQAPSIATAAIAGIVLSLILSPGKKKSN